MFDQKKGDEIVSFLANKIITGRCGLKLKLQMINSIEIFYLKNGAQLMEVGLSNVIDPIIYSLLDDSNDLVVLRMIKVLTSLIKQALIPSKSLYKDPQRLMTRILPYLLFPNA